jgi:mono/diheme cytochrome c family protein
MWLLTSSCTPTEKSAKEPDPVARGQAVYLSNCAACHNVNPKLDGSVGPAIAGSSLELVRARVLKASYPDGYVPKRSTGQMPAFPHLEKEVQALYTFLNSSSEK